MEELDCVEVVAHDDVKNVWRRRTPFRRQQAARPLWRATEAARGSETEFERTPAVQPRRREWVKVPLYGHRFFVMCARSDPLAKTSALPEARPVRRWGQ